jgi:hypothetical protein
LFSFRAQVEARIIRATAMQPKGEHVLRLINEGTVTSGVAALLRALRYGQIKPTAEGPAAGDGRGALGLLGGGCGWHLCCLSAIGAATYVLPAQRLADSPTAPKYDGSVMELAAEHSEPIASQLANQAKVRQKLPRFPSPVCFWAATPRSLADTTPSEGELQAPSQERPMGVVCCGSILRYCAAAHPCGIVVLLTPCGIVLLLTPCGIRQICCSCGKECAVTLRQCNRCLTDISAAERRRTENVVRARLHPLIQTVAARIAAGTGGGHGAGPPPV